ncbi:MAG: GDYXXLXY domain-containing protein [Flavobacteriales bacterium]|nr:GDYXXLXY domain-containing protein [Flavobacteriales bacterium]MBP6696334.1 GDYXXLXY domain-containing protein [Flavobacteriales bacterium]
MRKALIFFALVALAQWAVPLWTIATKEEVRSEGEAFLFRLRPVDPTDPFRGEYVVLRYEEEDRDIPQTQGPNTMGEQVYAILNTSGYAVEIDEVLSEPPTDGWPYVTCTVDISPFMDSATVRVDLPFDRYYLQEGDGAIVEDLMRGQFDGPTPEAYAVVRLLNGDGVIEDLLIDGRSVSELIREYRDTLSTP